MIHGWGNRSLIAPGMLCLIALSLVLGISCAGSVGGAELYTGGGESAHSIYLGEKSLEERIAFSDVIAKVRMREVTAGTTRWSPKWPISATEVVTGDGYVGTLEYRFEVLEYLHGTGDSEIVGVVHDFTPAEYDSTGDASIIADGLLSLRDNTYDHRDAIVFLRSTYYQPTWLSDFPRAGYHILGAVSYGGDLFWDYYTIHSDEFKQWLPATGTGPLGSRNTRAAGDSQTFYLEAPGSEGGSGNSGASRSADDSGSTSTITLADLKAKVASIKQEEAAGDGSEAYRDCIYRKYRWERISGPFGEDPSRFEGELASGLPAGSRAYEPSNLEWRESQGRGVVGQDAGHRMRGEHRIGGDNAVLFSVDWPGVVDTTRPLPAGEYMINYFALEEELLPCAPANPQMLEDGELFITVTAPEGTVYEAFFDPQTIGPGDGYISSDQRTAGELSPATFTIGHTTTTISSLFATENAVTMVLTTPLSLPDHSLDFIALNGSVPLSLDWGAATTSGSTLTWSVAKQPWSSGNELMLRLRRGSPITTPMPATTPTPAPTPPPSRR